MDISTSPYKIPGSPHENRQELMRKLSTNVAMSFAAYWPGKIADLNLLSPVEPCHAG
jgi:hypothetical protein